MAGLLAQSLILRIHATWAWVVIIGNGLAGVWALSAWQIPSLRSRALWWFTIVVELAIGVQVCLGVTMVSLQHRKVVPFHMFYGFVAIIAATIIYSYRPQLKRWMYQLYGFGGLFLMGLGIRAVLKVKG